jgi:hypothetical protein
MNAIYVMGDIHGQYEKLLGILRGAGLIGSGLNWTGGNAQLWFMGDFFDRGPDGIAAVDLVMRLQGEAAEAGGRVEALLGNHEPLILGAHRFSDRPTGGPGGTFRADWEINGGARQDLERLTPAHIAWLTTRPAMAVVGDALLVHADAAFYLRYGRTIDEVNRALAAILQSDDHAAWDRLLGDFAERDGFLEERAAESFLQVFGGKRIVHGHTPISYMTHQTPRSVTAPYIYAGGRCINVDGGMYRGGPGFLFALS